MYEVIIQQLVNVIALSIALFFNHLPTLYEMVQITDFWHEKHIKRRMGCFKMDI